MRGWMDERVDGKVVGRVDGKVVGRGDGGLMEGGGRMVGGWGDG